MTEREQQLYNLYFVGLKGLREIKGIMRIHDRTINSIFNKYGWSKRPPHKTLKTTVLKNRPYLNYGWLYSQYVEQNKTCLEIAKECDCGESTINAWLQIHNIPARHKSNEGKVFSQEWRNHLSKAHIGLLVGAKNNNWKGGITPIMKVLRHTPEYLEWRKQVFERDNYTCQKCGKHGGFLHAHHIEGFAKNEDLRTEVSNGITLCRDCHFKLHRRVVSSEKTILVGA